MAGYSTPRIFRSNKQGQFTKFLNKLCEHSFEDHLQTEQMQLHPVLEAASRTLTPHVTKQKDKARLSLNNIGKAYAGTGNGNGFATFSMPLVVPEQNFIYPTKESMFVNGQYGRNKTKHLKPDSYKRMFWTSAFGLLAVQSGQAEHDGKTYIFPTNTVPQDFLNIKGIDPVINAAAKLSALVNHDYFHQIIYCGISEAFGHRNDNAPINKHLMREDRKLQYATEKFKLDEQFNVSAWHIEPWAMRFHAEVLQTMVERPQNALEQAVDDFCDAVQNCPALIEAQGIMSSPPISPQDYATRLLAFNLIRALPLEHDFTQECIEKMTTALGRTKNPDSMGVHDIFDHMYNTDYKKILFGSQRSQFSPEEYSQQIRQLSAHAIILAQRDCEQAFRLQDEYERRAANENSPRARRLSIIKDKTYKSSQKGVKMSYDDLEAGF